MRKKMIKDELLMTPSDSATIDIMDEMPRLDEKKKKFML